MQPGYLSGIFQCCTLLASRIAAIAFEVEIISHCVWLCFRVRETLDGRFCHETKGEQTRVAFSGQDSIRLLELSSKVYFLFNQHSTAQAKSGDCLILGVRTRLGKIKLLPPRSANGLILLLTRTKFGKDKRPPELLPATFVQSGSAGRTRTYNPSVNSRMLCH